MRVNLLARRWGSPDGGPDGMAIAASFLAWTLCGLGHDVAGYQGTADPPPWSHERMEWRTRIPLYKPDDFAVDLTISACSPSWLRTAAAAREAAACERTVYWHHYAEAPNGGGCLLAAPPAVRRSEGWARAVVLPPSSWAADRPPAARDLICPGSAILVPGAGPAKGGHVALAVAQRCPDLAWHVLPGRCSPQDLEGWRALPSATIAPARVRPDEFLSRARLVLSPTRFEVHPLALLEAAVRGIPVVCSDLPGTRAATGGGARYVDAQAPVEIWEAAVREALAAARPEPLALPAYSVTVAAALGELLDWSER